MTVRWERRSCRPRAVMSSPSMTMRPAAGSIRRNSDKVRLDLPAPVRPTMPTWRREREGDGGGVGRGKKDRKKK